MIKNNNTKSGEYPKKKKRIWIPVLGILFLAAVVIGIIFGINKVNDGRKYDTKMNVGMKLLQDMDYDAAIIVFKEAIAFNPHRAEAYEELAGIYRMRGEYELAANILSQGYSNTKDKSLKRTLTTVISLQEENAGMVNQLVGTDSKLFENIQLNQEYINMVLNYTYLDYIRNYGASNVGIVKNNTLSQVTFSTLPCILFYENGEKRTTFDNVTGVPLEGKKASYIQINDISGLFTGFTGQLPYDVVVQLFGPDTTVVNGNSPSGYCVNVEYLGCTITIESDNAGNIVSANAWNRITPILGKDADEDAERYTNAGIITGKIIDATTGGGVYGAKIYVREGHNNRNGEVITEAYITQQGTYTIELPEGKYTVQVKKNGYQDEYKNISIISDVTLNGQNITISTTLAQGEVRVVMTWGSAPQDLDLHVSGSAPSGRHFHVYFAEMNALENGTMLAKLDVDDRTAYGPETITLSAGTQGTYDIYVIDYSNLTNGSTSTALTASQAVIKVYLPGQVTPKEYRVPNSGTGTRWNVCTIKDGQITDINTITTESY